LLTGYSAYIDAALRLQPLPASAIVFVPEASSLALGGAALLSLIALRRAVPLATGGSRSRRTAS
jgi:hypothetical protein